MTEKSVRTASLDEIEAMDAEGKLWPTRADAEEIDLGPEFWAGARVREPLVPKSVRLNLDPEVFEFFKAKGRHITRMQEVLKAYVRAHQGEKS